MTKGIHDFPLLSGFFCFLRFFDLIYFDKKDSIFQDVVASQFTGVKCQGGNRKAFGSILGIELGSPKWDYQQDGVTNLSQFAKDFPKFNT